MTDKERPSLGLDRDRGPVDSFVDQLQIAIDNGDAAHFNERFARDALWGSPFGAVAVGYDQIHAIHTRMFGSAGPSAGASRYSVEHVKFPTEDVAIAYTRRVSGTRAADTEPALGGSFDELALMVLVRRDGVWWLAAAQHVPDRRDVYSQARSPGA